MELDARFFDDLALVPNLRASPLEDVDMTPTARGYAFDGIAAPIGAVADIGSFTEEYERGAFRRFLAARKDNIPFVHEHNPRDLLATTRSGRLRLEEEMRGLRVKADIVKTDLSERIKALVDSGDIGGMSIGMVVGPKNSTITYRNGKPHRLIQGFRKILDVCTTFDPAYATTEAQFRSIAMQLADSPTTLQQLLMGAYPQLQEPGNDGDDTKDELAPPPPDGTPDEARTDGGERDGSGATGFRSVAARRRALSFYLLDRPMEGSE